MHRIKMPWYPCGMRPPARFDVLVIGSGASGLAAAVAAERAGAHVALTTKGSIQANNSSKAQGGIQAAFGADDSPELHAEDVMRSSHETADPRLVEALTGDASPRSTGWRSSASPSRGRTAATGWPAAGRITASSASGRRPHRARDHESAARRARGGKRHELPQSCARGARAEKPIRGGVPRST